MTSAPASLFLLVEFLPWLPWIMDYKLPSEINPSSPIYPFRSLTRLWGVSVAAGRLDRVHPRASQHSHGSLG